ncbi:MAG: Hsp20/alpha crystallin family protein [Candidatus Omnitrophota bacterium]
MKKILLAALICVLAAGPALAETPSDADYRDLEQLRTKLVRMKREMDKFIRDISATYPEQGAAAGVFDQDVRVDITENDKDIMVKADLPGMEKDKIEVTLENGRLLKIAGAREIVKKETAPGMVRQERSSGRFERMLELPSECLSEGIGAAYMNGVLEITIPKKAKAKEEEVKIKVR